MGRLHRARAASAQERAFEMGAEHLRGAGGRRGGRGADRGQRVEQLADRSGDGRRQQRGRAVARVEGGGALDLGDVARVELRSVAAVDMEVDEARQQPAPFEVDGVDRDPPGARSWTSAMRPSRTVTSAQRTPRA